MACYGILIRNEAGEAINFTAVSVESSEAALEYAKGGFADETTEVSIEIYSLNGPLHDSHNII